MLQFWRASSTTALSCALLFMVVTAAEAAPSASLGKSASLKLDPGGNIEALFLAPSAEVRFDPDDLTVQFDIVFEGRLTVHPDRPGRVVT